MTIERWLAYLTVLFLVCISPGPAVILTSAQAAARGLRSSTPIIAGVQAGNLIYFMLSALGLGAIIAASETAFLLIKYGGGGYLLFLGIRALLSRPASASGQPASPLWRSAFLHGLASQLANPKSVLFYAALLPQFIVPDSPDLPRQLLILAATGIVVEVPILATYAALAARGGALVGGSGSAWRERLTGSALIAAGTTVLLTRRSG